MKRWLDPLTTAWNGVISHKLRSFLTILGIVIGVAAVIALMSVGKGAEREILSNIESLGSNLITIYPGMGFSMGGVRGISTQTLTIDDAEAIAASIPDISGVAPSYSSGLQLVAGSENTYASVTGTTTDFYDVNNLELASGSFFTSSDYEKGNKVIVLGSNVAETLFPSTDPVGQQVRMGKIIARVIGVLDEKGVSFGASIDDGVLMPLTAMQQAVAQPRTAKGGKLVSNIALTVADETQTETIITSITSLLRTRHELLSWAGNDFNIMSTEELAESLAESMATMQILLFSIAAISLLVGGIGVMNIMLVSVLERTREIGIRKALGAKESDIWSQFLIEASFLSLAGGIIGIIVGWLAAFIISRTGLITTLVTADIVVLAVSVAVAIGLFFGFYPAWNASRLNPIQALRSE